MRKLYTQKLLPIFFTQKITHKIYNKKNTGTNVLGTRYRYTQNFKSNLHYYNKK